MLYETPAMTACACSSSVICSASRWLYRCVIFMDLCPVTHWTWSILMPCFNNSVFRKCRQPCIVSPPSALSHYRLPRFCLGRYETPGGLCCFPISLHNFPGTAIVMHTQNPHFLEIDNNNDYSPISKNSAYSN